ncbi:hypothetical protein V8D89_004155 [Ganoderma adspersum]
MPWVMKSLDELARIHPAVTSTSYAVASDFVRRGVANGEVTVAVLAFKAVLKGVESRTHIGLDGRVLKDRLEELAEKIKECPTVCDAFLKKRLLVKVFRAPVWAERLAAFVQVFEGRKADFQLVLAMHIANSLTDVKKQNYEIQANPEERKIALEVEVNSGATKTRESRREPGTRTHDVQQAEGPPLEQFKTELREDVDGSLERNLETFIGKFDLQYIHAENDRVIGAVTGPHTKIKEQLGAHFERMQEALLERLAETLTNALAGNRNVDRNPH